MLKNVVELVIGNLDEKKEYKAMMKRVARLPEDYRYTFKKIQHYLYVNGLTDLSIFDDLVELFETSVAEGKEVLEVIGNDVSGFADELLKMNANYSYYSKEKLNKEIKERFNKGGK